MNNREKVERVKALIKQLDLGHAEASIGLIALLRDKTIVLPPDLLGELKPEAMRLILLAGFSTLYQR